MVRVGVSEGEGKEMIITIIFTHPPTGTKDIACSYGYKYHTTYTFSDRIDEMASDKACSHGLCCLIVLVICIICFVVILPFSFSSLEFDEYGLRQRHTTGTVNREKVYGSGLHLVGPDYQ
jgi:hypothetical protein